MFLSDTSSSITFALLTAQIDVRGEVMDSILSAADALLCYLARD